MLTDGCQLMAVIKSDAYGHGIEKIAEHLQNNGVCSFAVASASEGVKLRKHGIKGDILVLGYTHAKYADVLQANDLSQLIIDGTYATALNKSGHKLRVHIAIDTGLHSVGIDHSNFDEIISVYECENLTVEGVATHFASSDSLTRSDIEFTNMQNDRFLAIIDALKERGYNVGKLHSQSSYGVLNYPGLICDFARVGMALLGVLSGDSDTVKKYNLKPILSLRAVIAQVRRIGAGESVSYGRNFTTDKPMKLATVNIGYADGIARNISGKSFNCIVHGKKVPIVGRICMDFIMLDVTQVETAEAGDIVTLIGRDGDEVIRCEDLASAADTITNEIFSRLGIRLPRIYF